MNVLYVFRDAGVPGAAKLGYNAGQSKTVQWPCRYKQARSHTPRPIHVAAAWDLGSANVRTLESCAKKRLETWKRPNCGDEWFDLPADELVERVTRILSLPRPFLRNEDPPVPVYDDWRELKDTYKGQVWRRYLWIHGEDGPERRFKVIHSPDYDTAFRYAFTYNPYPVRLVAAYEHPSPAGAPSVLMSHGNREVEAVWERMMNDPHFADRPDAPQVGWLKPGISLHEIDAHIRSTGLIRFDLRQPKPPCAKPRTSQIKPPIPHGSPPPFHRIADWL